MSSFPLVSIVLPCYNAQEFLREALDSAVAQTWPAVEIIAVDDCSTDSTPALLSGYEQRFQNFRYERHSENRLVSAARNTGYALARGEYILWLDSDDYLAPDFVAVLMREAVKSPEAIIAGAWRKVRLSSGAWTPDPDPIVNFSAEEVLRMTLRGGWPLHCMACLFPRRAVEEVNGWNEQVVMHEDRLLLSQLLIRRFPFVFVQESCAFYRLRKGSTATKRSERVACSILDVANIVKQELQQHNRLNDFANDFANFLDLYYIDSLPDHPAIAAEFLAMRKNVCGQYRDLRAPHSRMVRALVGDYYYARLARLLGVDAQR